jgi:hypothetical protein
MHSTLQFFLEKPAADRCACLPLELQDAASGSTSAAKTSTHMVSGTINLRAISDHWFELLRLALSVKTGTVTASVILRKLAAYPRQNGLALALRELGKWNGLYSPFNGCKTPSCVVVAMSVSTRASNKTPSAGPYSLTASVKSATALLDHSCHHAFVRHRKRARH